MYCDPGYQSNIVDHAIIYKNSVHSLSPKSRRFGDIPLKVEKIGFFLICMCAVKKRENPVVYRVVCDYKVHEYNTKFLCVFKTILDVE